MQVLLVDYDKTFIPDSYDAGRDISASEKRLSLKFFAEKLNVDDMSNVIDLGCGTARFSEALADVFEASVVGIDPSTKMLEQARNKTNDDRLRFALGSGEALPVEAASADMVFMSMVLHHLADPEKVAQECRRVLRNGGSICIRNTVSNETSSYPYLRFFPSIGAIIGAQLISRERLNEMFLTAGFKLVAHQSDWHEVASNWQSYADKLALKADSFVARLSDSEFKSGLEAIRKHAENQVANERVGLNVDLFVYQKH